MPSQPIPSPASTGIDPERLQTCLAVLAEIEQLDPDHAHAVAVRRATAGIYKEYKQRRRKSARAALLAHDDAVTARTATGAPGRIDDETQGLPLVSSAPGAVAGVLRQARACYICKQRYTQVDAFYHQLCPGCAAFSHARRQARTDLTGRRALLTGGRAKIGMHIALRLLRDGADLTVTTRFPHDAARRFASMPDAADWLHRLRVVGLDLRDPTQVVALADLVRERGHLDILINNAAQNRAPLPGAYAPLVAAEAEPLPAGPMPQVLRLERTALAHPDVATSALGGTDDSRDAGDSEHPGPDGTLQHWAPAPHALTALALAARSAAPERIAAGTAIDAGGLVPDLHDSNSWVETVEQIDPLELLEVQLCNQTAPFILISRLRPALAASPARRRYIVNVSAMEGVFSRGYKGPGHPHTNMAKAALNMLTRTSGQELFERDRILMTAVDTGWITDERPHPTRMRLAEDGFHAPLDLVDGAARVYDPIVRGEAGEDLYGVFLKDYAKSRW